MERGRELPACVVYAGRDIACDIYGAPCRPADALLADGDASASPSVLLVDDKLIERISDVRALPEHVVIVATDEPSAAALGERAELSFVGVEALPDRRAMLLAACQTAVAQYTVAQFEEEFHELSRIGIGLMREHDRKVLLRMIVAQAKALTHSDGGGLALKREDENGHEWLHPVLYAFDSIDEEVFGPESAYPVDENSIIGHAALIKNPLVVADAYDLPRDARFERNVAFDIKYNYRRRSMLCVPMLDQRDHVLGVLICVNRKTDPSARIHTKEDADRYVIGYSNREVRLVRMLASQAAAAIENARLYAQVENAFESFVQAAVSGIDMRDPATAGHSVRVAELVTRLAEDVERKESGPYRDVRFTPAQMRELRFAALLHDIGKVGVPEAVLLKAKSVPPVLWERINARFDLIRRTMELECCRSSSRASEASRESSRPSEASRGTRTSAETDAALAARLKELEHFRDVVHSANEPTVLHEQAAAELVAIAARTYRLPDGTRAPYLTPEELHYLHIPKGTLDDRERAEVQSHAVATRDLLSHIPWTDDLKNIGTYASGHHELLNGEGYPDHLAGDQIPLQTRLITIADIFDALTASDRPYKPAVPVERALEMLRADAEAGQLDPELVKVLTESQSYRQPPRANRDDL